MKKRKFCSDLTIPNNGMLPPTGPPSSIGLSASKLGNYNLQTKIIIYHNAKLKASCCVGNEENLA